MFILWIFLIYLLISYTWYFSEIIFYGETTPRLIDDVIAIILAVSLYLNF